jgi:hypothetical protein
MKANAQFRTLFEAAMPDPKATSCIKPSIKNLARFAQTAGSNPGVPDELSAAAEAATEFLAGSLPKAGRSC